MTEQSFDKLNFLASVTRGSGTPEAATETDVCDSEGNRALFSDAGERSRVTALDGFGVTPRPAPSC